MPMQRSISRIVTPGPAIPGCRHVGHSFIEVIRPDDFIGTDPFVRLTDDRLENGNKEIGAPHPHGVFSFRCRDRNEDATVNALNR